MEPEQAIELLNAAPNRALDQAHRVGPTPSGLSPSMDSLGKSIDGQVRSRTIGGVSACFGLWRGLLRTHKRRVGLEKTQPMHRKTQPVSSTLILDLRSSNDFDAIQFPGSLSVPIPGLSEGLAGGDLFGDAEAVHMVWTRMQKWLHSAELSQILSDAVRDQRPVLVLCYDGLASQLGSSIMRQKGLEAFTVRGGFQALWSWYRKGANI